jgi:hypothetical protein
MNIITTILKTALTTAKQQIFSSGHLREPIHLTKKCQGQAQELGLTETDVKAVYNHGTVSKSKFFLVTKDYNGYSLTVSYFLDKPSGHPVITSIRKWEKTY